MIGPAFWDLVDETRPSQPDPELHAAAIARRLVDLGVDEAIRFGHALDEAVDALDSWDLWGAGFLLLGGLSDDGYEYLRAWIVGEGRTSWERARTDPEGFVVALVEEATRDGGDLAEEVVDRGLAEGEPLLSPAGVAHEELTGAWLPPHPDRRVGSSEGPTGVFDGERPRGDPWEEADLPSRFPRLAAALDAAGVDLEPDLLPGVDPTADRLAGAAATLDLVASMIHQVWEDGELTTVVELAGRVLDDPDLWSLVRDTAPDAGHELAYRGGMSRLQLGDPDGAARWLGLVARDDDCPPAIRRGLAQIELARGNLDEAGGLIDDGPDAALWDRVLVTALAGYRGDAAAVRTNGRAVVDLVEAGDGIHPFDRAGMLILIGQAGVEAGGLDLVTAAAAPLPDLLAGSPPDRPLVAQASVLRAARARLSGDLDSASTELDAVWDHLSVGTCDRGTAEREQARVHRQAGREDQARLLYERAVATFAAAHERHLAATTEIEAASGETRPRSNDQPS